MLLVAMAFFLIPFPYWKYDVRNLWRAVKPASWPQNAVPRVYDPKTTVFTDGTKTIAPFWLQLVYAATVFCLIVSVILMLVQFIRYQRTARLLLSISRRLPDEEFQAAVEQVGIKRRKVAFYSSPDVYGPITFGIFHPVVIFPARLLEHIRSGQYDYLATHELTHIKNGDSLAKALCALAWFLHWFNPVGYLLFREYGFICEICCDAAVIKPFTQAEMQSYFQTAIALPDGQSLRSKTTCITGFANRNFESLQRRVQEMQFIHSKKKKGLALVSAFAICACTIPTAFAYSIPPSVTTPPDIFDEIITGPGEGAIDGVPSPFYAAPQPLPYDEFFTDEFGNVYECSSPESEAPSPAHTHSYRNGTYTKHVKNSSGGCTVTLYSARICDDCGNTILGNRISTTQYDTCPH